MKPPLLLMQKTRGNRIKLSDNKTANRALLVMQKTKHITYVKDNYRGINLKKMKQKKTQLAV